MAGILAVSRGVTRSDWRSYGCASQVVAAAGKGSSRKRHSSAVVASPVRFRLQAMNTSKITVRLDAEHREAELEVLFPHHQDAPRHLEQSLRRIGIRANNTRVLSTPRFRVTRTKLSEIDGSVLDATRVMQILRAVHSRDVEPFHCCKAA